jgi:hypothetical protein
MRYFACLGGTGTNSRKSTMGHVTPNLCFCIRWDMRVTYYIPVVLWRETSTHYFSGSCGTSLDSTKKHAGTRYAKLVFCIRWHDEDITSPDTTLLVTFDSKVKQFFIMGILNTFDELMLHHDVCSTSFAKVLTWIKVSRVGSTLVTITSKAPTLCCSPTACLGSGRFKVSPLGCAFTTVTPKDVLNMGSVSHIVHYGASEAPNVEALFFLLGWD